MFIYKDKNTYKVNGILTEEDINKINSFKNRTTLILDNTKGLSSSLITKINSDRVIFSIKGGLDYETKEKYKTKNYIDRTLVSVNGLKNIIKYFEYSEKFIDPSWNELEKAMFLYNSLVVDMEYADNYDNVLPRGVTERSLNGILYGKLVCAGFALVYKEMLDRVGIKNYYQNQRDVHAFNIIEIDGKRYGVDVTWDNCDKKNNDGICGFTRFGHDPEFYFRHGHQLYKEVDISDDLENPVLEKIYDEDEEEFDLSLLDIEELKKSYRHIVLKVQQRKPLTYNLQDQSIEIKDKYLPIDTVQKRIKQEASYEYPITIILNFLNKRDALEIDSNLIQAFNQRKNYLLDIGNQDGKYNYGFPLGRIGLNNYEIDADGTISFINGEERRYSTLRTAFDNTNMSLEEIRFVCDKLNEYLKEYMQNYIEEIVNNLDNLLKDYEYDPYNWDNDRAIESTNISSKLAIIVNSKDYLLKQGIKKEKIDSIINKINSKYKEIHEPYEKNIKQKDLDLDFLSAVFDDAKMIKQIIEYDLQKEVSEEEFMALCSNPDYIIELFEKYITISGDKKFKLNDYEISKNDLKRLLNKLVIDYQKKKIINEMMEDEKKEIKR